MAGYDLVGIFLTLQRTFGHRVHAIRAGQWADATPDAEWDVADLVAHLVTEHRWVDPLLAGLDLETAAAEVDKAGTLVSDDQVEVTYVRAWDEASAAAGAAFSAPAALDRTVSLWRGDTPASAYIREMIFDLTIHSWDLGRAIDYPGALPADVVEVVWHESAKFGDLSASGLFDTAVSVPADAPALDRLIAMTGRDPR